MIEKAIPGKDLIITNGRGEVSVEQEQIDLPTAKKILQTVVSTHEKSLDVSSLDIIGGNTIAQVRQAFELVSTDIIKTHKREDAPSTSIFNNTAKNTPYGKARITVFNKSGTCPTSQHPIRLDLSLTKAGYNVLESMVPLRESESWVVNDSMRFSDFRKGTNVVSAYDLGQQFTLDKYRYMWRGVRWTAANLLNWENKGIILPEELDAIPTESIPQSQNSLIPSPVKKLK